MPEPWSRLLNGDCILIGEFCEIQGPTVVTWSSPRDWFTDYCAAVVEKGDNAAECRDSDERLHRKNQEDMHKWTRAWNEGKHTIPSLVRKICNNIIMRILTGDIVYDTHQMACAATVCIDAVPWLGDALYGPFHQVIHDLAGIAPHVATTAAVVALPDSIARGFTRTMCIVHISSSPLVDETAAIVTSQLRSWAEQLSTAAKINHVKELQSLDLRLRAVTDIVGGPDNPVTDIPTELTERTRKALEHFVALPDHTKRRFFEEKHAVERRLQQLDQSSARLITESSQLPPMASRDMVDRLLGKGSHPLRPLDAVCPNLRLDSLCLPETSATCMREWMPIVLPRLVYASLCNLRCCIYAPLTADESRVEHMETLCRAVFDEDGSSKSTVVRRVERLSMSCFAFGSHVVRCRVVPDPERSWKMPVAIVYIVNNRLPVVRFPLGWSRESPAAEASLEQPWTPPPESCIAASLRHVDDAVQLAAAVSELRNYIRGRSALRLLSFDDAKSTFEQPLYMVNSTKDPGGSVESNWLLNCMRSQAAVLVHGSEVAFSPVDSSVTRMN